MWARLRKSINLGGDFKVNLSKSGIGYSWEIPSSSLSYVDEKSPNRSNLSSTNNSTQTNIDTAKNIESADMGNFKSADVINITSSIERTIKLNKLSNIFLWLTLLTFEYPIFFISTLIGIILKIICYTRGVTKLEYTFSDKSKEEFQQKLNPWYQLLESQKIWQIIQDSRISNQKINAGATRSIHRIKCVIKNNLPFYISANINSLSLYLEKESIHLLPDKLFIIRKGKVGAIDYSNLNFQALPLKYIEEETLPKDTQIVNTTWKYVNKNGNPDKRFKNNRELPVCLYGKLLITSTSGIHIELHCSNQQNLQGFLRYKK